MRRTRSKIRWVRIRWAASRSPMTPSAASTTAALKSTAPRISDWTWPAPSPLDVGDDEARRTATSASDEEQRARASEDPQRLVLGVDAEDRDRVAAHVAPTSTGTAATRASCGFVRDRHVVGRDEQLAGLDDRLERVGELRDDLPSGSPPRGCRRGSPRSCRARRCPRRGARPTSRASAGASSAARSARSCPYLAVADDHVGVAGDDRRDQLGDVARRSTGCRRRC